MPATRAVARRTFAGERRRTLAFAVLSALYAVGQVQAYAHSYSDVHDRMQLVATFGANKAIRLLYGIPYDLLTNGGYAAWRIGGLLTIVLSAWGMLAAIAALRGEEDAGRAEVILAGAVSRRQVFRAVALALGAWALLVWFAVTLGLVAGGLDAGGSAFLAAAITSAAAVFIGVGALVSQLAPRRRVATALGSGVLVTMLMLRIVADTSSSLEFLHWLTPFGWSEQARAFTGSQPAVLVLPGLTSAALLAAAAAINARRDTGRGLIEVRESAPLNPRGLGSPTALALRGERGVLIAWGLGLGSFAFLIGVLSSSVSDFEISDRLQRELDKLGAGAIATPTGYLSFVFLMVALALSLFACSQVTALRREESEERLETLFAGPVDRRAWLAGRMALTLAALVGLALISGVFSWAGATAAGADVSFPDIVGAGLNTLPVTLVFGALGVLAYALVPRAAAGLAYGLVGVTFIWQLFGALLGAPGWTLDLSPFHHLALVPTQSFKALAAAIMVAGTLVLCGAALRAFRRRDLIGV